jgi:two-component system copper resistance phosphate regulon response regulator CusR
MRLLVIEDHAVLRESLVRGLTSLGYAVDATGEGTEGLWYAQNHPYDAIVLDLMLPGMDGLALLHKLRKDQVDTPVLVVTARDSIVERVTGLDEGADDYLVKPFAFDELAARIRALVRRRYDRATPVVRVADLEIDLAKRTARRAGVAIELSAREFALLEHLANRCGEVVSRADLMAHVYAADGEPWSNVLDVYISHLRRKIDSAHERKLIHTRRGYGYMLGEVE